MTYPLLSTATTADYGKVVCNNGHLHTAKTAVSNWAVGQKSDYEAIFTNLGSTTSDSSGTSFDATVNAYITTGVGGSAVPNYTYYWSASEDEFGGGAVFSSSNWIGYTKTTSTNVRPVLGF